MELEVSKLAIVVKSCHRDLDRGCHDVIRQTWGRDLKARGVDTFFFVGKDPTQEETRRVRKYESGEVVVDCKDDYLSLPVKTRRICQWLGSKMFSHAFFCDNDTMLFPDQLLNSGFEKYDYSASHWWVGRGLGDPGVPPFHYVDSGGEYPECRAWASGGFGYFLSHKASNIVADAQPTIWAEDLFVGQLLAPLIDKRELIVGKFSPITEHFPTCATKYDPKYMIQSYEKKTWKWLFNGGPLVA
jgi:hypothetical protein